MVRFLPALAALAYLSTSDAFAPAPSALRHPTTPSTATTSTSSLILSQSMLTETALPSQLYFKEDKEQPKLLGGLKIGSRKLTVITGASSGLGLNCAATLAKTGRHFVVMACRDVEKGKRVAREMSMPENSYVVMKLELASLQSVRDFVTNLNLFKTVRPIDNLICNAAVYKPTDPEPKWTDDGFEQSMGINHFGHFLLVNLLVDDLAKAKGSRCCIVGSITGNTNTVGEFHLFVCLLLLLLLLCW